jgi:hypothetical protein
MAALFGILALVAGLASLVFFIMVLIQLFKTKGALHGILGIICGLYTFIWGWINADAQGLKKTMVNWTIAIIAQIILQGISFAMGGGAVPPPSIEVTP